MSVQRISVFPLATSFKVNDVLLGNKSNTTSRFSFSTVTHAICSLFLENDSFVFVPAGATAGQVIAYDGTSWTTSSNVSNIIIGGSSTPRATLDVLGGIRAKQGAPSVGNISNFGYAFEGDGDTGMFSIPPPGGDNNGSLSFFLNQVESMRLAVGGNIGIGITNPLDKLHIDGGIIASQIKTNDPAAIFEILGGTSKATAKSNISVKGIGEIEFSTGNIPTPRVNINNAGTITFYNSITGTRATFSTSVSAPALSGSFFGNIRGATGIFSTSVTAPTFFGSLQGGTVTATTGNFSTSVTAPIFFGSLQGGTVRGSTATLTTSVSAPALSGSFYGGTVTGTVATFSTSVSAPALSGCLYGDTVTGNVATFNTSVSAPALSGSFYGGTVTGTVAAFSTSVSAPALSGSFYGDIMGRRATFSTSVSAPALSGSFFGNIRGATGIFSTSVTAPTFIGNLQGGTVTATTGNFTGNVTAPNFLGNLQGATANVTTGNFTTVNATNFFGTLRGNVIGATGNFSTSVVAAGLSGSFFGDGGGLTNLRSYPFASIRNITTFGAGGVYTLVNLDVNTILAISNGATNVTVIIPLEATFVAPIGTQIILIQQGTGAIAISPVAGVTLISTGNRRRVYGQNSAAVLIKIAANSWFLGGDIKI